MLPSVLKKKIDQFWELVQGFIALIAVQEDASDQTPASLTKDRQENIFQHAI